MTRACVRRPRGRLNLRSSFPWLGSQLGRQTNAPPLQPEWSEGDMHRHLITAETDGPYQPPHPSDFFSSSMFSSSVIRDNWSLSEILEPITPTAQCWHSHPLHLSHSPLTFLSHSATSHCTFFLPDSTFLLLFQFALTLFRNVEANLFFCLWLVLLRWSQEMYVDLSQQYDETKYQQKTKSLTNKNVILRFKSVYMKIKRFPYTFVDRW